jgi:hypothetical protein
MGSETVTHDPTFATADSAGAAALSWGAHGHGGRPARGGR